METESVVEVVVVRSLVVGLSVVEEESIVEVVVVSLVVALSVVLERDVVVETCGTDVVVRREELVLCKWLRCYH